ncbi:NAD-P-binding protein [Trametes gibbosa]|nr:NAD-P-binding protein [Trametes gibbosa]
MSPATTTPTTWLITGTFRGIGLAFVRELVASPDNLVIASCLAPEESTELAALKKDAKAALHIIKIDMSDFADIRASAAEVEKILGPDLGLDYLISNAAIAVWDSAFSLDPEDLLTILRTNTVGPAVLSQVMLPFLERGREKKILHISSTAGSVATARYITQRPITSYSVSKAALNMLVYRQKMERPDLTIIAACPGHVRTALGGAEGLLEPEESARELLKLIKAATPEDSGKYLRYNGEVIPW